MQTESQEVGGCGQSGSGGQVWSECVLKRAEVMRVSQEGIRCGQNISGGD